MPTVRQLAPRLILLTFLAGAAACDAEPAGDTPSGSAGAEDGRDDTFLGDGKADTGGVSEGSLEAAAVLRVANETPEQTLSDPAQVGLAPNAAANIVAYRVGDDGVVGTADDRTFKTLADLDGVPFIGPKAFAALLGYATKVGYLGGDPFTLDLTRPAMGASDLVRYFAPGATSASVGTFSADARTRAACNPVTGCPVWSRGPVNLMTTSGATYVMPASGNATLVVNGTDILLQLTQSYSNGRVLTISCNLTSPSRGCRTGTSDGGQVSFEGYYAGEPRLDNTTMLEWKVRAYADGTYHLVTATAVDLGTDPAGANNQGQISITGTLKP
jgi:hypothetical protein